MADTDGPNAYELLEVGTTATEAEIRKAYRQKSLKVHPDRVSLQPPFIPAQADTVPTFSTPTTPLQVRLVVQGCSLTALTCGRSAQKFHELNNAYELLLDPIQKASLDVKIKAQQAKKLRFAAYDNKRKAMMEELEKSERDFKKSRLEAENEREMARREEERIKEEGRRMMKEREERATARVSEQSREAKGKERERVDAPPLGQCPCFSFRYPISLVSPRAAGPLDTTIRLKYSLIDHPTLSTVEGLTASMQAFGIVDRASIVLSIKPNKKNPSKPAKAATALVPFSKVSDAFAAVMASGRKDEGLEGVNIDWVEGKEPELVTWLKEHGQLGTSLKSSFSHNANGRVTVDPATDDRLDGLFSSFPDDLVGDFL